MLNSLFFSLALPLAIVRKNMRLAYMDIEMRGRFRILSENDIVGTLLVCLIFLCDNNVWT